MLVFFNIQFKYKELLEDSGNKCVSTKNVPSAYGEITLEFSSQNQYYKIQSQNRLFLSKQSICICD